MTALADLELRRARWRRAREACHLLDAEDPEFARGGLAGRLGRVSVRLLVLPGDPEGSTTPVDEDWLEHLQAVAKEWGKAHGVESLWGFGKMATAGGACLYGYDNSSSGPWNQYLCMRSDGGLDVGLGAQVFREWDGVKCFFLSAAVGRRWSALAVHAELSAKGFGPCEVTLALVGVGVAPSSQTVLG